MFVCICLYYIHIHIRMCMCVLCVCLLVGRLLYVCLALLCTKKSFVI